MTGRAFQRVCIAGGLALLVLSVAVLGYIAILNFQIPDPPTRAVVLPSGRTLEVIHTGPLEGGPPRWLLEYRTHVVMSDRSALQREVTAVWKEFEAEADHSGYAAAMVMPVNFSRRVVWAGWRPVITSHHSTAFLFDKQEDGIWREHGVAASRSSGS